MILAKARLCIDCEWITTSQVCEVCNSKQTVPLTKWIKSLFIEIIEGGVNEDNTKKTNKTK